LATVASVAAMARMVARIGPMQGDAGHAADRERDMAPANRAGDEPLVPCRRLAEQPCRIDHRHRRAADHRQPRDEFGSVGQGLDRKRPHRLDDKAERHRA
jgi:hypothetical protein